ncbi:class I adenylate-forming enzyme family protein [Actinophytocola oryzae]|uniref:Acyl-CoA synthetase (AMP-forming)/AMP-acid ligase II n=1 Tax=Actinophytocola oryzae TaxID=502181 RepID=A0A4R7VJW2_9PSEU|nr:class I adenylate-forming enzyme family protein [Actinophytocola oryzae]TDV49756.1 acyl-CoA synthetase (AMP-forming)/AMP-acid ligase II [Actinophytocola oryzae]
MNGILLRALTDSVARHPESLIGARAGRETWARTLDDGYDRSRRLARVLPGDRGRVAIIRRNSPAYVSDLLAVLAAGHVPMLMDPALGTAELARLFADCGVDAVLHDDTARLPALRSTVDCAGTALGLVDGGTGPVPQLHPDTELCRLTSGSTRTPGCIEFSGAAVTAAAAGWRTACGFGPEDRILCFAGLYNGLGFNAALIPGLLAGASMYLPAGLPSAGNLRRHLVEVDPTVLVAFPAAYDGLAASDPSTLSRHKVRLALSSAARLSTRTSSVLAAHGIRIGDYYGIAETGPLTFNPDPQPGGGQGRPLPGVSLLFDGDPPTLLARSRSMGTRYLNYPGMLEQRITESGHYRTSDQGMLTADGELRLGDRVDDTFSVGGKKFSADEIEELLSSHPDVTECAVTMVVREGRSFLGAAVVAPETLDIVAVRRFCLARAAAFKVPERLVVVQAIPRNGAGKVQRAVISKLLLAGLDQPSNG